MIYALRRENLRRAGLERRARQVATLESITASFILAITTASGWIAAGAPIAVGAKPTQGRGGRRRYLRGRRLNSRISPRS
jgi:hypothetical protein